MKSVIRILVLVLVVTPSLAFSKSIEDQRIEAAWGAYQIGEYEKAVTIWRPLAEQGNADAQNDLGISYLEGKGVRQDDQQAVFWFRKSAEQGYMQGQFSLAWMYEVGRGIDKNQIQAAFWYEKAAKQGNKFAQNALGLKYLRGEGILLNYKKAIRWFRKAAEQKHAFSQYALGGMYFDGVGVELNLIEAYAWLHAAWLNEYEEAKKVRDKAAGLLSPSELERAKKLASKYYTKYTAKGLVDLKRWNRCYSTETEYDEFADDDYIYVVYCEPDEIIELIVRGVDVNQLNSSNETLLYRLIESNDSLATTGYNWQYKFIQAKYDITKYLLGNGAKPLKGKMTYSYLINERMKDIQGSLDYYSDKSSVDEYIHLFIKMKKKYSEILALLQANGAK